MLEPNISQGEFDFEPTPISDSSLRGAVTADVARKLEKEARIYERKFRNLLSFQPVPDEMGISFGNAWLSYDKILGYDGPGGARRIEFYNSDGIAVPFMAWARKLQEAQR